jgi:hypothetical protein
MTCALAVPTAARLRRWPDHATNKSRRGGISIAGFGDALLLRSPARPGDNGLPEGRMESEPLASPLRNTPGAQSYLRYSLSLVQP